MYSLIHQGYAASGGELDPERDSNLGSNCFWKASGRVMKIFHDDQVPLKILFVDDDKFSRSFYVDALRDEGYKVIESRGVRSALAQAEARAFDAVILDIMLPPGEFGNLGTQGGFKTGLALARELRGKLPEARFLALTM